MLLKVFSHICNHHKSFKGTFFLIHFMIQSVFERVKCGEKILKKCRSITISFFTWYVKMNMIMWVFLNPQHFCYKWDFFSQHIFCPIFVNCFLPNEWNEPRKSCCDCCCCCCSPVLAAHDLCRISMPVDVVVVVVASAVVKL